MEYIISKYNVIDFYEIYKGDLAPYLFTDEFIRVTCFAMHILDGVDRSDADKALYLMDKFNCKPLRGSLDSEFLKLEGAFQIMDGKRYGFVEPSQPEHYLDENTAVGDYVSRASLLSIKVLGDDYPRKVGLPDLTVSQCLALVALGHLAFLIHDTKRAYGWSKDLETIPDAYELTGKYLAICVEASVLAIEAEKRTDVLAKLESAVQIGSHLSDARSMGGKIRQAKYSPVKDFVQKTWLQLDNKNASNASIAAKLFKSMPDDLQCKFETASPEGTIARWIGKLKKGEEI